MSNKRAKTLNKDTIEINLRAAFNPSRPVSIPDLFSGRREELDQAVRAVKDDGRHPVVFGARGVGKTSLANIVGDAANRSHYLVARW